jgi:hypothetical protein
MILFWSSFSLKRIGGQMWIVRPVHSFSIWTGTLAPCLIYHLSYIHTKNYDASQHIWLKRNSKIDNHVVQSFFEPTI